MVVAAAVASMEAAEVVDSTVAAEAMVVVADTGKVFVN